MQDWEAHCEFLQLILTEFDADWAEAKGIMIFIFWKSLRLFVRIEMNQRNRKLDSLREIIERAVNAKATAKPRPSFNTCEMDQNYPQNNYCIQPTIAESPHWAKLTEDPQDEPSNRELTEALYKPRTSHPLQFCSLRSEKPDKKFWREKKKQYRQEQRQGRNSRTPVRRDNIFGNSGGRKDLNHITCFNFDKTGHYANKCLEPQQNQANTED